MVKDVAKSVKNRLLEQTRIANGNYQQVLIRFFHERLMFRLSKSKYRTSFYLKGGSLLFALNPLIARPTLDVDLLGINFPSKPELLRLMFVDVCSQTCPEDGVTFDVGSISVENIMNDKEYLGLNVKVHASLDTVRQWISIDVGFGDSVVGEKEMSYPVLLENLPRANIFAYSVESVVAEKFHAMVMLDEGNSRMKDFFDVYQILKNQKVNKRVLESAIKATFKARKMEYHSEVNLFTLGFANNESRNVLWRNFLRGIKYTDPLNFEEVMNLIRGELEMYWTEEMLGNG